MGLTLSLVEHHVTFNKNPFKSILKKYHLGRNNLFSDLLSMLFITCVAFLSSCIMSLTPATSITPFTQRGAQKGIKTGWRWKNKRRWSRGKCQVVTTDSLETCEQRRGTNILRLFKKRIFQRPAYSKSGTMSAFLFPFCAQYWVKFLLQFFYFLLLRAADSELNYATSGWDPSHDWAHTIN